MVYMLLLFYTHVVCVQMLADNRSVWPWEKNKGHWILISKVPRPIWCGGFNTQIRSAIHLFIYSSVHSPMNVSVYLLMNVFTHHSCIQHLSIHMFTYSFIAFTHYLIHRLISTKWLIHSFIHLSSHLLTHAYRVVSFNHHSVTHLALLYLDESLQ